MPNPVSTLCETKTVHARLTRRDGGLYTGEVSLGGETDEEAGRSKREVQGFKRKALARWRWLAARDVELEAVAAELRPGADELRAWIDEADGRGLIVPVRVADETDAPCGGSVVVLTGGLPLSVTHRRDQYLSLLQLNCPLVEV